MYFWPKNGQNGQNKNFPRHNTAIQWFKATVPKFWPSFRQIWCAVSKKMSKNLIFRLNNWTLPPRYVECETFGFYSYTWTLTINTSEIYTITCWCDELHPNTFIGLHSPCWPDFWGAVWRARWNLLVEWDSLVENPGGRSLR